MLRLSPDNGTFLGPQVPKPIVTDPSVVLSIPPEKTNPELPHCPDAYQGALQHLVSGALPQNELTALIETVVLNVNAADIGERCCA